MKRAWPWALVGVGASGAGLGLALALRHRKRTRVDRVVLDAVCRHRTAAANAIALLVGAMASPTGVVASAWLLGRGARSRADRVRIAAGAAIRVGMESALKHAFGRSRPARWRQIGSRDGSSLPSGHTLATATYLLAATTRGARPGAIAAALGAGAAVGASRIYLGAHRVTDVAASLLIAVGAASLVEACVRKLEATSS